MGAITVRGLGKAYKTYPTRFARLKEWLIPFSRPRHELNWVLQDINFTVSPGEAVGIIGLNGAGKSTLLKTIAGTTKPTTGSIAITGRIAAMLELGIGFHPDFTGRQNVIMAGQLLGFTAAEIANVMPWIEAFAEIGDYIDNPVRIYSSGMQVRLAFAVATSIQPEILIVDEALSVGDAYFQAKCYRRINFFKQQGMTLILVSHSAEDLVKHCERAIMLKDGRIEQDGSAREVTNRYLDELSGKKFVPPPEAASPSAQKATDQYTLNGNSDEFHTRPGYHSGEHRWGNGGAAILDYLVIAEGRHYPSRIESNKLTDFHFKVRFDANFDNVIPGLLIKTLEGIFLYGTNSFVATKGGISISAHEGDIKIFKFSVPLRLNEGNYLVSFGISSGHPPQELIPLDRRYDSVMIRMAGATQFWGIVDMDASFQVAKSTKAQP